METSQSSELVFRRRIRTAEKHLISSGGPIATWVPKYGRCDLEIAWERSIYESLVRAVAHQQLHSKAAQSILGRLVAEFPRHPFPTSRQLARAAPEKLRSLGFSNAKVAAIQGIARAAESKSIPTRDEALIMTDAQLIEQLLPLRGVGRWTIEMLLIFTLGRMDVMPVDDFGVRSGLKSLGRLDDLPKKAEFADWTDAWSPYRTIGAWYLWRLADSLKVIQKSK